MKKLSLLLALTALSMFVFGCAKPDATSSGSTATHTDDDGHEHGTDEHEGHEGHDHAAADHAPPHGGHLIELGRNHEYHAELVDDHKTESIIIYIMDGDMKPLSINQASVSLVLTAGDNTQTFELLSSQPGGSSEFTSNDEAMMGMIETEGVTGKLRVTINEKPFSGSFEHHAHGYDEKADSHEGHDH